MAVNDADLLDQGNHPNPFAYLGLHESTKGKTTSWVLRAYDPEAITVEVMENGKKRADLKRVKKSNVFEVTLKKGIEELYVLKSTYKDQNEYERVDPYQFEPLISDFDLQLWGEGNHNYAHKFLGSHVMEANGVQGVRFAVCAPSASRVSVIGDFNNWDGRRHPMRKYFDQGIWEIFIPKIKKGSKYKFEIKNEGFPLPFKKSDPYGRFSEVRPATASVIYESSYSWKDEEWLQTRKEKNHHESPLSVYEVHPGSWRRSGPGEDDFLSYTDLAKQLISYVKDLGFTHIELMPIAEHPYDPSWGYQVTGYFAPTSRFGSPDEFKYFVDQCHQHEIGVIVDWVPAHFTKDDHGLRLFDGTHLYEHADPRQGEHKDWGTNIFNFGRTEVINFLISNANFWIDEFHIDGLRVDAVASMLYLDYSREEGEWIPNKFGGRENLEAIDFLKRFNEIVHQDFPGVITLAEESTAWPMVSKPTYLGGLGFDFKWNMGWMNDTLKYMENDPIYRRYHHGQLTFSMIYAFTENFMLPLSHDEVVHGKNSMIGKMPGDDWQKFANLRLLYTYMFAHPGKKLLFMGDEFGQWKEWDAAHSLDWNLLEDGQLHKGLHRLVKDLNSVYTAHTPMHQVDFDWTGFEWIDFSDVDHSILSFIRYSKEKQDALIGVFNFTPVVHPGYYVGVPSPGTYTILVNSDQNIYGGSNVFQQIIEAEAVEWHNQPARIQITLPPLAGILIKQQ